MIHENIAASRRAFVGRLAGGSAALVATGALAACAQTGSDEDEALLPADGDWLAQLHGAHRQYFDVTEWKDGTGLAYAMNWTNSMRETYGVANDEVCAVIGLRHFGIAPAFPDAIWSKYHLGEFFKIVDPKTNAPSTRNFAYNETAGDFPFPGMSLAPQVANGAIVTVCNLATTIISGLAAQAAGLQLTPEDAYQEWRSALMPGCHLVPTGVLAINRAQTVGDCTYCYAG